MRKKLRFKFILIILLAAAAGLVSYPQAIPAKSFLVPVRENLEKLKINLGLDLQGGIHLEYRADVSGLEKDQVNDALLGVQDVIERRVNAFGVAEPLVQIASSSGEHRVIIELAGVKNIDEAKAKIKETPFLEFKEQIEEEQDQIPQEVLDDLNRQAQVRAGSVLERVKKGEDFAELAKEFSEDPGSKEQGGELEFVKKSTFVPEFDKVLFDENLIPGEIYPELVETQFGWHIIKKLEEQGEGDEKEVKAQHILIARQIQPPPQSEFKSTGLSGKHLERAEVNFRTQGLSDPIIVLKFNGEGKDLFAEITKRNVGKVMAIFLDGEPITAPRVQEEITAGEAIIEGDFTLEEARTLSRRLNEGALPIPIELVSQQSVEASLGQESLQLSLKAGMLGLALVMLYMIFYYRFFGFVAAAALVIYTGLMVSIFKLSFFSPWQITLTLSGIAGFVLSVGMAVDANILIFERTKEEIGNGRSVAGAIDEGFKRAWPSIRDANLSTLLTSIILVSFGTGFVKGFAIILSLGVLVSMFTAIVIVKIILRFASGQWMEGKKWMLMKIKMNKEIS